MTNQSTLAEPGKIVLQYGEPSEMPMPLHDWNKTAGWEGVHDIWLVELLRWVKPRLPEGLRAYIGSTPGLTVGSGMERPDVAVRRWLPEPTCEPASQPELSADTGTEPDVEVASITLDPQTALYVANHHRLVAAIELISPRNKDRDSSRATYLTRYLSYLQEGAHLLLVDVHRRPLTFSFADALAKELQIHQPSCPAPLAVAYRVGEPAPNGGRLLAIWRRSLQTEAPLPDMPLPLTVHAAIQVDLEETYVRAAADAYLT